MSQRFSVNKRKHGKSEFPDQISFGQMGASASRNNWEQSSASSVGSGYTVLMSIHPKYCGKLIGKQGSKIRELQEQTSTIIEIDQKQGDYREVPVNIRGDKEGCLLARELIEELTDQVYKEPEVEYDPEISDCVREDGSIDWGLLKKKSVEMKEQKWASLPAVLKNFYIEDDEVRDMTKTQVEIWRKDNFDVSVKDLTEKNRSFLNPVLTFEHAFHHYPDILKEIYKQGFKKPSPIQSQMWPLALKGHDVIGIAQTGTGKTLAFLLPAFIHIDLQTVPRSERVGPSAIILTPTRELALQIQAEIEKYFYHDINCVCVYGGGNRRQQIEMVTSGVEIIVATPGRFNDLLSADIINLDSVTYLVLDEADRMLDLGFEPQIMKIIMDITTHRQTIMTSATWPEDVRRLAQTYLSEPFQVNVGSLDLAATHTVQQFVEIIDEADKRERLYEFLDNMDENDKVLVFVGRKVICDDISTCLAFRNVQCESIHGGREQEDREQSLEYFKSGKSRILIATDVASRGLDVKDITHVFNYDFPRNTEEYVHRVGRTGRAERTGISISLLTREDWRSAKDLINILEEAEQDVPIELREMADRYAQMQARKMAERGRGRRGGNRGSYRGSYRGGYRGGNRGGRAANFRSTNNWQF